MVSDKAESAKAESGNEAAESGPHFAAFLSYSHADSEFGEWLHKTLEAYRTPPALVGRAGPAGPVGKRIGKVFRDRADLSVAHDLGAEIRSALAGADALIVLCSPRSAASPYVAEEIRLFKQMGKGQRIFAAIVDGEPHAAGKPGRSAADECFPRALVNRLAADGSVSNEPEANEPIAADFRDGKDGRENGSLKVIAGLLGAPLDDLVQRHRQAERRRRLIANGIAAAMAVLALGAATAGFLALQQRNVAEQRRVEADSQRDRAETALAQVFVDAARTASDAGDHDKALRLGVYALRLSGMRSDAARVQIARALYASPLAGRFELASDWDPAFVQNSSRHPEGMAQFRFGAFLSGDGSRLAGVSAVDLEARLWDVASGKLLTTTEHSWNERGDDGFDYGVLSASGRELVACTDAMQAAKAARAAEYNTYARDKLALDEPESIADIVNRETVHELGEMSVEDDPVVVPDPIVFNAPELTTPNQADPGCEPLLQTIDGMTRGRSWYGFEYEGTRLGALAKIAAGDAAIRAQVGGEDWRWEEFPFYAAAVSRDGLRAALGFREGTVALAVFGADIRTLPPEAIAGALLELRIVGRHTEEIKTLNFSTDGRVLASASLDGLARVWRVGIDPGPMQTVLDAPPPVSGIDGDSLRVEAKRFVAEIAPAEENRLKTVTVTERADGRKVIEVAGDNLRVFGFSPDESLLLIADGYIEGGTVGLYSTVDGKAAALYEVPFGYVTTAVFAPDGQEFAAGVEGAAMVWSIDPQRGLLATAEIAPLTSELEEGDSGLRNVAALAFSPDGQLLATGSAAGLQVWNWADAALIAEMRRPVSSGLRFASQTRLEFVLEPPMGEARASESALGELGVFNWWGVKPAALAWDLSLLSLPADKLLGVVCGAAAELHRLPPGARTFAPAEARTDRLVRQIWRDSAGGRADVCSADIMPAGD